MSNQWLGAKEQLKREPSSEAGSEMLPAAESPCESPAALLNVPWPCSDTAVVTESSWDRCRALGLADQGWSFEGCQAPASPPGPAPTEFGDRVCSEHLGGAQDLLGSLG